MNDLKVLENGLVTIYTTDTGEKVVDGRELWESLKSKTDFSTWVKRRLGECDAIENTDYSSFLKNGEREIGGTVKTEYIIQLATAKEMAMLERNEVGKSVRKYFIKVEEKFQDIKKDLANLSPQLQLLINMELRQKELEEKQAIIDKKVDNIRDIVALNPTQWRKDTISLINKMALKAGGYGHIGVIREEAYRLLEQRFGVQLNIRLTNKKKTLALSGVCKSKIDKVNQVDVIADDKKLIEGFIAIIKELAIKYGIDIAS